MVSSKIIFVCIVCILLVFLSLLRPMNYDEAYYIESARLLSNCCFPYSDFHFHLMPLIIIIYSPFSSFGFWSLVILKFVSVIFIFLTCRIYNLYLSKSGLSRKEVVFFSVLFFLNSFLLDWFLTIKIYSLSAFLLAGYVIYFGKFVSIKG